MIVLFPRILRRRDSGRDVLMVKRALSRAGYRRWGFGFTIAFGPILERDLVRFQKDKGIKADGIYGTETHKRLAPYFDAYGASVMSELYHDLNNPMGVAVHVNIVAHAHAWQNAYTQTSSRMMIVRWGISTVEALEKFYKKGKTLYEDCSSFQTGASFIAKLINPNTGTRIFSALGYTGTMAVHGRRVWPPKKGDLALYGSRWPYKHVVRCLEDGTPANSFNPLCGSHGKPGFDLERMRYRGDFSHCRRYDD